MKILMQILILICASMLCFSPCYVMADWDYIGKGSYRPDNNDGFVLAGISLDVCKNVCDSQLSCRGIEYLSSTRAWDDAEWGMIHNRCEIHREMLTHCDTSYTGGEGEQDGCWLKNYERGYEFIDGDNEPPTRLNGMHTCPSGYLVTGVDVNRNLLLCMGAFSILPQRHVIQDWGIKSDQYQFDDTSMHWCGYHNGLVVVGLHAANNGLNCERVERGHLGAEFVDKTTVRAGMRACPKGMALRGIHVGRDALLCVPYQPINVNAQLN